MKRFFCLAISVIIAISLCSCDSMLESSAEDPINEKSNIDRPPELDEDQIQYYGNLSEVDEDQILYYEGLCDFYGYQTYDGVFNPEKWKYYVDIETGIAHNDWLCEKYDRSHRGYRTAQLQSSDNVVECSVCSGARTVFLDENKGVFHSEKRNLNLGTDDYISCYVDYKFVSIENAIKHGYTYCSCCHYE